MPDEKSSTDKSADDAGSDEKVKPKESSAGTEEKSAASKAKATTASKKTATKKSASRSGRPGASKGTKLSRQERARLKGLDDPLSNRAWLAPRFLAGAALVVAGIAWLAYYYLGVRVDPANPPSPDAAAPSPAFMADLERWNYLIGFAVLMVGLAVLAHKSTPLGRGRGVVVGMLGCFIVGLLWICTFYVFTDDLSRLGFFEDLGQFNLVVGIAFMGVGFTFATKWE